MTHHLFSTQGPATNWESKFMVMIFSKIVIGSISAWKERWATFKLNTTLSRFSCHWISLLWSQAGQVIQSYGSSISGYGFILIEAYFIWAFSLAKKRSHRLITFILFTIAMGPETNPWQLWMVNEMSNCGCPLYYWILN